MSAEANERIELFHHAIINDVPKCRRSDAKLLVSELYDKMILLVEEGREDNVFTVNTFLPEEDPRYFNRDLENVEIYLARDIRRTFGYSLTEWLALPEWWAAELLILSAQDEKSKPILPLPTM
jgi:hypothetical protein